MEEILDDKIFVSKAFDHISHELRVAKLYAHGLLLIKQHTYSWKGENKVKMIDIEILFGIVLSGAPRS